MPQEPKRRHSRERKGKRRAAIHLEMPIGLTCSNCNKPIRFHTVCKYCGYYNGKEVIAKKAASKTSRSKQSEESLQ